MMYLRFIGFLSLLISPITVDAAEQPVVSSPRNFGVAIHASTLGIGPDLTYVINPYVKVGVSSSYFSHSISKVFDFTGVAQAIVPITIEAQMRPLTVGTIVDIHPFGGAFYIRGGLFYNGNQVNLNASFNSVSVYFNGSLYTFNAQGAGKGKIHFNRIAPYAGLGFNWGSENVYLTFDAGILFQGKAKAKVTELTGLAAAALPQDIKNFEKEAEDQINKYSLVRLYPVVSLGVCFKF